MKRLLARIRQGWTEYDLPGERPPDDLRLALSLIETLTHWAFAQNEMDPDTDYDIEAFLLTLINSLKKKQSVWIKKTTPMHASELVHVEVPASLSSTDSVLAFRKGAAHVIGGFSIKLPLRPTAEPLFTAIPDERARELLNEMTKEEEEEEEND